MIKAEKVRHLIFIKKGDKKEIGKRFRESRKLAGITRKNLAEHINKGPQQINRYEDGAQMPSLEVFSQICSYLEIDPKIILGLEWKDAKERPNCHYIYSWKIVGDYRKIKWICPECGEMNIIYGDWNIYKGHYIKDLDVGKLNVSKIEGEEYICSKCETKYDELFCLREIYNG